jgi:hypothetical protein
MKLPLALLCLPFIIHLSQAQRTVGLLSYQKEKSYDGYTLLYPHNQPNVFLINNCGEIVHSWPDSSVWRPGNTAYLTDEGKLIKTKRSKNISGNPIWFGGGGARVEIRDWDNTLKWSYEVNDTLERLHHDIKPMPNGHILMILWQKKTKAQLAEAGRDTITNKEAVLHTESIIEVDPKTNKVVWRWNLWDHMIQDADSSKPNYGDVASNSGKVDINYPYFTDGSWYHMNAIDYNEELDQILVSVPTHNEIWIIDHSTTTAQAATDKGGLSGVGGDLMFRWGNAATYKKAQLADKQIGYQHGVHWIRSFLAPSHPNFGKINLFNNRAGVNFSEVQILSPPWDMYEWKYKKTNGIWGPAIPDQVVRHPEKEKLFSDILSNAQYLPNGNMLILSGRTGYIFELSPEGQIVWEYKVPFKNGAAVAQGSVLATNDNTTFRVVRYPSGFAAFSGRDLSRKGFIESGGDNNDCEKISGVASHTPSPGLHIFPNPATGSHVYIQSEMACQALLMASDGTMVRRLTLVRGENSMNLNGLAKGLYFLTVDGAISRAIVVAE